MDHISLKCACVVLVLLVTLQVDVSVCSLPSDNAGNTIYANNPRQNQEKYSPMWFGPRMGRKKRSENLNMKSRFLDLMESLNEYPWTIIAISANSNLEKRTNTHNFTPRLGRTLDENHATDNVAESTGGSVPFPAPFGNGHHFNPFSPRLGRSQPIVYV